MNVVIMDPLIVQAISIGFGLLLLNAARHKLSARTSFMAVLGDYQLLPETILGPALWLIIGSECVLGCAWFANDAVPAAAVACATSLLLIGYTIAIAINLLRGRVYISCGCGLSNSAAGGQSLSWGLVLRNILLVLIALLAALPGSARALGVFDIATLIATLPAMVLLYIAVTQLLTNSAAIGAWRNVRD
jgi:Methylamine utilisation protein MauE